MLPEKYLKIYYCEICSRYYIETDMVIYKMDTRTGKCRECVRELERKELGMNVVRCENSLANSKTV